MSYGSGFESGRAVAKNPFAVLLNGISESYARRRAEDTKRASEENELRNSIIKLGAQNEYDKTLQREKAITEGKMTETAETGEGTFELPGPFGAVPKRYKSIQKETPVYLVDPITGETRQVSSTPKGSKVLQQKPTLEQEATKAEVKKLAEIKPNLDRANEAVQELKKLFTQGDISKSVKKGDVFAGLGERTRGIIEGGVAKAGGNPKLQQYLKMRKSFASLLTKGAFLEAGVLTNPDIERALGALPTTGMTKEEIEIGWKVLDNIMTTAQRKFEELKSGKQTKSGGQVMTDANGNKAVVYPDGSFEEIK